jgi:hypothetical protein
MSARSPPIAVGSVDAQPPAFVAGAGAQWSPAQPEMQACCSPGWQAPEPSHVPAAVAIAFEQKAGAHSVSFSG